MTTRQHNCPEGLSGILLVNKPRNKTSFSLVGALRRLLKVRKIGHAGTLDPFATGLMVMLIGREYTRLSDRFLNRDKEYVATVHLGIETDTCDCDGTIRHQHSLIPSLEQVHQALENFQGNVFQIPPMYSAKKKEGKKLYELARKGIEIEREPVPITLHTQLIKYEYPYLELLIKCSKGTYIRTIAYDLGRHLQCGAHLSALQRTRSGEFHLNECLDGEILYTPDCDPSVLMKSLISYATLS